MKEQISRAIKQHLDEAILLGRADKTITMQIPESMLRWYMMELKIRKIKTTIIMIHDLTALKLEWK